MTAIIDALATLFSDAVCKSWEPPLILGVIFGG